MPQNRYRNLRSLPPNKYGAGPFFKPKWHDKPKEGINIEESTVHEGFEHSDAGKTASWMG
jgi:hypothetical protein